MLLKLKKHIPLVFKFLQKIPKGKVVTYKMLAKKCGLKNPRNVGYILRQNTEPDKIPCYKVALSSGKLAKGYKFGGEKAQKKKLLKDGIIFSANGKIQKDFFIK